MNFRSEPLKAVVGLLIIAGLVFPLVADGFQVFLLSQVLVFVIAVVALDIAWGYGGILNLGHAIFFGGGAYVFAFVATETPFGQAGGVLLAVVGMVTLAVILGFVLFLSDLGEAYFGILMLALAATTEQIIGTIEQVGGHSGMTGVPGFGLGDLPYYYLVFVLTVAITLGVWKLLDRPFGFRLRAMQMNESRTEFLGYDTRRYKLTAFASSAAIASLAGVLHAGLNSFVSPRLTGLELSVDMVIWLIIGGVGTLIGGITGTFAINYIDFVVGDILQEFWLLFLGTLFIVVVLGLPRGIYPFVRDALEGWYE